MRTKRFIDHSNKSWQLTPTVERTGNLASKIAAIFCKLLAMYYEIARFSSEQVWIIFRKRETETQSRARFHQPSGLDTFS